MHIVESVLLGIISSIFASSIFWWFSFHRTKTKVEFPQAIEKSKNTGEYPGKNRYRIKIINSGIRDLIEVTFLAKLSIKRSNDHSRNYTYIGLGNENQLPIMYGKRSQKKRAGINLANKLTFFPIQTTCNEFQKSIYPSFLRNKAQNNTLSLDDIFDNYRDSFELKVYVFGNDALTGARKLFISPTYTLDNIKTGKYITPVSLNAKKYRHCRYKKYVEDNLAFLEDVNGVY